jgi:hypothetical protein
MSSYDHDVLDFNENDDADDEAEDKKFDQKELKNLKIRIENDGSSEPPLIEEDGMDGVELSEPVGDLATVAKPEEAKINEDEEGPEFHVTLDKVPAGLQNTILVCQICL